MTTYAIRRFYCHDCCQIQEVIGNSEPSPLCFECESQNIEETHGPDFYPQWRPDEETQITGSKSEIIHQILHRAKTCKSPAQLLYYADRIKNLTRSDSQ